MNTKGSIAITSANSATAKILIPELNARGYDTIGLVRKEASIETHEVVTNWMESDMAKQALANADIIIHLTGEINAKKETAYIQANLASTQIVAQAAASPKVKRVIFLSYPGANAGHKNWYLRYKGMAEQLLEKTGKAVIFRCPFIVDSPHEPSRIDMLFMPQHNKPVQVIGSGREKMHPVYRGDVADAVLSSLVKGKPGTYELSGCEEMTTTEFIYLVNKNNHTKIRYTPGWLARLLSPFIKGLSPTFVDVLLNHTNSTFIPDTYKQFDINPTSLVKLWRERRR